jgi:GAF domain
MAATLDDEVADLRRTNAELQRKLDQAHTERDDAEAQKAASSEVLEIINSSPGDLAPVFEAVLDKATSLCDATFGILWTYDGSRFYPVALHRTPPAFADFLRGHQSAGFSATPGTAGLGAMLDGEAFQQIFDAADGELYRSRRSPLNIAFVELGGARSGLLVPLRHENKLLGAIRLFRQEVRPFSTKQISLLQNVAAQAVIAMENARLITETREALEQQTATAEVLQVINSSPGDIAPVFDAMLEKALRLCGAVFGGLFIRDGENFYASATRGLSAKFDKFVRQPNTPGPGSTWHRAAAGEDVVHVSDIAASPITENPLRMALIEMGGAPHAPASSAAQG